MHVPTSMLICSCLHTRTGLFIIRDWFMGLEAEKVHICCWQAGDPGEPMEQVQSEGRQAQDPGRAGVSV